MRRGAPVLIAALLSAACGDPIAPGDFEGESRMHLEGIVWGDAVPEDASKPTVGILWKWFDRHREQWALGQISSLEVVSFPVHFTTEIYDLPPTVEPNTFSSDGANVEADVGCPVVFDDRDGDGRYGSSDELLAVSWNHLLVYVHEGAGSQPSPLSFHFDTAEPIAPGYRLVQGVCEKGAPSGRLSFAPDGALVPITLLQTPGMMPETPPDNACIRFF